MGNRQRVIGKGCGSWKSVYLLASDCRKCVLNSPGESLVTTKVRIAIPGLAGMMMALLICNR